MIKSSGHPRRANKVWRFFKKLGPGLVTGASDDDPSGIATYSQAGAQFGLATLWTALLTFPLMAAIQGMCARIGMVTLEPLAGKLTYAIFATGVIGTGLLAIPVLAGSQSYMLAETFGWKAGLDKKFTQAEPFYISIIISLIVGLSMDFFGISPIKALLLTAIAYGLTAPVMVAIILHIGNNKKIMNEHTNSWFSNILGIITLLLMSIAAVVLIYYLFK